MTLEQLRIFVAVAEREHVTAGARALHVTQSAASAAVATLEERHGIKLFHRVGRGIALTEVGRMFLDEARAVLARAEAAELVLEDFGSLRRGSLRVVASQTIAAYWLPPLLAQFQRRHAGVALAVAIGNTEQAAGKVRDGTADLGIVEGKVDDPALAQWVLGQDRLVLVGAAPADTGPIDAGPVDAGPIDAGWLRRARWVMREEGSGTRSTLNEALRGLGVDPTALDVTLVLPSNESVRTAVEAGAGVTALSTLVVAPAIAAGRLTALPLAFGPRALLGLRHKERYRTKAADALLALIGERSSGGPRDSTPGW